MEERKGSSTKISFQVSQPPFYQFQASTKEWTPIQEIQKTDIQDKNVLKIVTYNVWFNPSKMRTRMTKIFSILKEIDADIIFLQEVTTTILHLLLKEDWIQENYLISDNAQAKSVDPYGALVLCKIKAARLSVLQLSSNMGRNLLMIKLEFDSTSSQKNLLIAGTHLESLIDQTVIRAQQAESIGNYLKEYSNSILVGDFNPVSQQEQRDLVAKTQCFVDTWDTLVKDSPGFTFDTQINTAAREFLRGKIVQTKCDLILFHQASKWKPISIKLIGTTEIEKNLFPSDHFGLVAEFQFN